MPSEIICQARYENGFIQLYTGVNMHKVEIPQEVADLVNVKIQRMIILQSANQVPHYTEFVNRLFKEMTNAVDGLHHAATGCATEAGELLDASKKQWVYNKPLDIENLLEELGDLRFYYQALLNMLGLDDEHVQALNMAKLVQRYPELTYTDHHAVSRLDKVNDE